jgi:uncharacterized protein (TIGR02453 family)
MGAMAYFSPDGLAFLRQLRLHNDKAWFDQNKGRFDQGLREPGLRLVSDLAPTLKKISKYFEVDPRPNGGSMARIYRDTRFSKDKSPYKTALFFHFYHRGGTEDAMPAFYLRFEPGASVVGGGVWHPSTPMLEKIRKAIVKSPKVWGTAKGKSKIGSSCTMGGESLKKVPRGYDPDHPYAEDLMRRDFGVSQPLDDAFLTSSKLIPELDKGLRTAAPVLEFLCKGIGLAF